MVSSQICWPLDQKGGNPVVLPVKILKALLPPSILAIWPAHSQSCRFNHPEYIRWMLHQNKTHENFFLSLSTAFIHQLSSLPPPLLSTNSFFRILSGIVLSFSVCFLACRAFYKSHIFPDCIRVPKLHFHSLGPECVSFFRRNWEHFHFFY